MQNNKVIAIWGSPDSGKTSLSVKLANLLSQGKKDVALVFCDPNTPMLPVILPQLDVGEKSLGKILSAPEITQDIILSNCVTMKKNGYLTFMGYRKGENSLNYPNYVNDKAVDLIIQLRHLADYIILDCVSYFTTDILSSVALEMADSVITLGGCRLKDLSCFASLLPILQNNKYNQDRHIRVLSNHRKNDPIAEYKEMYRNIMFELPNVPELEQQFAEGDILESLATAEGRDYENTIKLIAKEAALG
jgi:MinD-like ATPase involved in chromosome partitioning or flagellar assembly